jgi:hypothetical protein
LKYVLLGEMLEEEELLQVEDEIGSDFLRSFISLFFLILLLSRDLILMLLYPDTPFRHARLPFFTFFLRA